MARVRIAVALSLATIVLGVLQVNAEDPPADVDATRASERHAIEAGSETLLGAMLGIGEDLPGGCKLTDGKIERTSVLATYGCGTGDVVLQLRHPDDAPAGGTRTERFAVDVERRTAPPGLVDAIADRIRAREKTFTWTDVGNGRGEQANGVARWLLALGAAIAAFFVYRALRRRGTRPAAE